MDCRHSGGLRRAIVVLVALVLLPASISAQAPQLRIGDEVRVHRQSSPQTVSGRIEALTFSMISIRRFLDYPPTKLLWAEITRVELRVDGEWAELPISSVPQVAENTEFNAGALAGRTDAEKVRGDYFLPAFLSAVPVGYLWICWFGCEDLTYSLIPAGGLALIAVTTASARKRADNLVADLRSELADEPPAYRAGYIEAYEKRLRSRFRMQAVGGALAGVAVGFGALLYSFSRFYD